MTEDVFSQKLQRFKENEKPEVVLFIADRPELAKIVIAWTNTAVGRSERPPVLDDESETATWEWLWASAAFSRDELLAKCGQGRYNFDQELAKLIGNRILYPDGTVHSFVQRYLRDQVLGLFGTKTAKKPKGRRAK